MQRATRVPLAIVGADRHPRNHRDVGISFVVSAAVGGGMSSARVSSPRDSRPLINGRPALCLPSARRPLELSPERFCLADKSPSQSSWCVSMASWLRTSTMVERGQRGLDEIYQLINVALILL